jgi:hypothetical protein
MGESERIEQAVRDAVVHQIETELARHGLLLTADRLAMAEAEVARLGARLLTSVVDACYPGGEALVVEFESEGEAARIEAALAFGAVTAGVLILHPEQPVELLCAMFNLATGLVDGLCDGDAETGRRLLALLQRHRLAEAAEELRPRGWLRAGIPPALGADPSVAFTVELLETFFETVHAVYPDDELFSRALGAKLDAALEAERRSVEWSAATLREQLIECSRRTSVLPFQIIQTLATGDHAPVESSAATLLGEAMWRIDDLVDLCQDARSGALNGVLLAAAGLEDLLDSTDIAEAAGQAAESLLAGLRLAGGGHHDQFLCFIQRYAGIS